MHKTFLNKEEIKVIKNADQIINKIGGFPSMENGKMIGFSSTLNKDGTVDIELKFNLTGWLSTLDYYLSFMKEENPQKQYYKHKPFEERTIKITFKNCGHYSFNHHLDNSIGEIKFGGREQFKREKRHQDALPGIDRILEGPYCCFYIRSGEGLFISFDENKSEISAELY